MFKKIKLSNTPTPIHKIQLIDGDLPVNLYIKRDDFTGIGLGGNKVRKLEYLLQKAIEEGMTDIITCGAIQSNHCRATAIACAKLGLGAHLVLAGDGEVEKEANSFLDLLAGAEQKFISREEYANQRQEVMEEWKKELEERPETRAMIIPEGASCGLGSLGYLDAFKEIMDQEREMDIIFDTIVITTGSGGSLAGLIYGKEKFAVNKDIVGISVSLPGEKLVEERLLPILQEMNQLMDSRLSFDSQDIWVLDDYKGLGYGESRIEELEFIRDFTSQTGVILDPVYTGKAMYGVINELTKGRWKDRKNLLFIHTGGVFGWTRSQINQLLSL